MYLELRYYERQLTTKCCEIINCVVTVYKKKKLKPSHPRIEETKAGADLALVPKRRL